MSTIPNDEAILKDELATLRIVRATLESVKQLAVAIHKDVDTATKNCKDMAELHKRWDLAIEQSQGVVGTDQSTVVAQSEGRSLNLG